MSRLPSVTGKKLIAALERLGFQVTRFKRTPNIKAALRAEVDPDEFTLGLTSEPFPVRGNKRIAVKVVEVYGNESTVVRDLS